MLHRLGFSPDVERWVRARVAAERLDHVRLLGQVAPEEVLAETDVLVFPSHLDGPGRSVFEAGARGIPAVVALRHRVEDVVTDNETGLIVPEKDPEALARAIRTLADDPDLRRRLGEAARARYRGQFAPERAATRMVELYRKLARRRAAGPGEPVVAETQALRSGA